jgi:hypothetical protein
MDEKVALSAGLSKCVTPQQSRPVKSTRMVGVCEMDIAPASQHRAGFSSVATRSPVARFPRDARYEDEASGFPQLRSW